jgi:hypothetical protein
MLSVVVDGPQEQQAAKWSTAAGRMLLLLPLLVLL